MKFTPKTVITLCLVFVAGGLFFYKTTVQESRIITPAELPKLINDRSFELKNETQYFKSNDPNQLITSIAKQNKIIILSKIQKSELWELQLEDASIEALVEWLAQLDANGLKIQTIKVFKSEEENKFRVRELTLIAADN